MSADQALRAYHSRAVSRWKVKYTFADFVRHVGPQAQAIDRTLKNAVILSDNRVKELFEELADDHQGRVPINPKVLNDRLAELALDPGFFATWKYSIFEGGKEAARTAVVAVENVGQAAENTAKAGNMILQLAPIGLLVLAFVYFRGKYRKFS